MKKFVNLDDEETVFDFKNYFISLNAQEAWI
jgi:hypothetical protein